MKKRMSLNQVYDAAEYIQRFAVALVDGETQFRDFGYRCRVHNDKLVSTYLENRVYLVVCPTCQIAHIVKAENPMQAQMQIGYLTDDNGMTITITDEERNR